MFANSRQNSEQQNSPQFPAIRYMLSMWGESGDKWEYTGKLFVAKYETALGIPALASYIYSVLQTTYSTTLCRSSLRPTMIMSDNAC